MQNYFETRDILIAADDDPENSIYKYSSEELQAKTKWERAETLRSVTLQRGQRQVQRLNPATDKNAGYNSGIEKAVTSNNDIQAKALMDDIDGVSTGWHPEPR